MKKTLFALLLVALAATTFAEVKTVPTDVMSWYSDVMVLYIDLSKGIDKAANAKAAATSFDVATAAITAKKLGPRYRELKKKYPNFFEGEDTENSNWVPPAEWMKVVQDYGAAMQGYAAGMQKVAAWYQDAGMQKSMDAFSEAAGEIGSD